MVLVVRSLVAARLAVLDAGRAQQRPQFRCRFGARRLWGRPRALPYRLGRVASRLSPALCRPFEAASRQSCPRLPPKVVAFRRGALSP